MKWEGTNYVELEVSGDADIGEVDIALRTELWGYRVSLTRQQAREVAYAIQQAVKDTGPEAIKRAARAAQPPS